jgi:hypothetical protein
LYVEEVEAVGFKGMCMDCDADLYTTIINNKKGGNNMGFKIFNTAQPTQEVFFKLAPSTAGAVMLVAVKASGVPYPSSNILKITADGRIQLQGGINKNIGLQTNPSTGKVVVV